MQYTCPSCGMIGANGLDYYEESKVAPLCHVCKSGGKFFVPMVPSDKLKAVVMSRAFIARLKYEQYMGAFCDQPFGPSRMPPKGHRMIDYAVKHRVTIQQMKDVLNDVERYQSNGKKPCYLV